MLNQLLSACWLRPETAMWRFLDIRAMKDFKFESPSMDFGSGDGMFSFIRAGGEFDAGFDIFQATVGLDKFHENIDVFDVFNESVNPVIAGKPHYQIDVAFDHKENLLKKAATLGLYKDFKLGDGNEALPFDDESFASIFSNIVYWMTDPQAVLKELHRVLKPSGKLCLMLPNNTLPDYSFYNSLYVKTGNGKWSFLEKLDRGRFADDLIKQNKTSEEWEALFDSAGFKVEQHNMHLSKPTVQIWDIGMRPLFPALMGMVKAIPAAELPAIKRQWVETIKQFIEPLIELDGDHQEHGFHCYILSK